MATTLSEQVYNKLLEMIIQRELLPGQRLPSEMALCEKFGVSRNTLRTALNKMDAFGLTVTRHGDGTYVKEVDSEVYLDLFVPAIFTHKIDLLEIMQFRKGIEIEAARLSAVNANEEEIAELSALLEKCKDSLGATMSEFASSNTDFHAALAKASHNTMLQKMMDIIRVIILPEMQRFLEAQGNDIDSTFYHEIVLRCIIQKKPDEAAFFMDKHLQLVIDRVEEYLNIQRNNC